MSDEFQKQIEELKEYRKQVLADLQAQSNAVFFQASQGLFLKWPNLEWFGWRQGEPWNDGEETEFEVPMRGGLEMNGYAQEEWTSRGVPILTLYDEDWNELEADEIAVAEAAQVPEIFEDIRSFLGALKPDDLEMMFGNGAAIKVYRDHIDVEEYEDG